MTMHLCYRCKARPFICCDVFGRWMCQPCASKWLEHVKDVIGTADGQAWCCEESVDAQQSETAIGNQAATEGLPNRLMEGPGMLVLSRRRGEAIMIGDDVVIEVCQIKGNIVKIGIAAPKDTRILRSELEARNASDTND